VDVSLVIRVSEFLSLNVLLCCNCDLSNNVLYNLSLWSASMTRYSIHFSVHVACTLFCLDVV
jgi:hypothetical protein